MKIVLAGAFGNLGADILRALVRDGHQVVAADLKTKELEGLAGKYTPRTIDVTRPETLAGLCDGADVVITTVGLTGASATITNYDIDYHGNLNLLAEAKKAGVQHFTYISVIQADSDPQVPMLHAKALFEQELKASGIPYVIHRPTGYFYDIAKVFMPMIDKGQVTLLGKGTATPTSSTPPTLRTSSCCTCWMKTRSTTWAARRPTPTPRSPGCSLPPPARNR